MRYPKECVLKDCQEAVIRPLVSGDEDQLAKFYEELPEADRWFIRHDTTQPDVLRRWFKGSGSDDVASVIAICKERIVGHGSLRRRGFGITRHVGRIQIVVLPDFRRQRLGTWLMLDLIQLAMDKGLEEIRIDLVTGIEDAAIEAATGLDFFKAAVLRDYVKDSQGQRHDLAIMVKRLHKTWSDF